MNIVNSGSRFQVYGEDVKTSPLLPVQTYNIRFAQLSGFYLTSRVNLTVTEDRIYGMSKIKVDKVLRSYNLMANRNFGVLLSGQKGVGKSLFVRMLAQKALEEQNLPIIVVDTAYPGIANFISSIDQECVVIFDEFEKVFEDNDDWKPQDEMLSLFDGIDGGHKLFIVTCNNLDKLSQYMLNRPGRFHYHISMMPPSESEIREYMTAELLPENYNVIDDIVALSGAVDMPYDYLRAIAFEVNQGYTLKESMQDLNITRVDNMKFDVKVIRKDGTIYEGYSQHIDLTEHRMAYIRVHNYSNKNLSKDELYVDFMPARAYISEGKYIITDGIKQPHFDEDDFYNMPDEEIKKRVEYENANTIEMIVLTRTPEYGPTRLL